VKTHSAYITNLAAAWFLVLQPSLSVEAASTINDFGVNHAGRGNLRGLAYNANVGWINFESTGAPKVDLQTGRFSGSIYSANCGWISISNTFGFVQTDAVVPGIDSDGNRLPDAWERVYFGATGVNPNDDPDHDSVSNLNEHLAGTNLNDTVFVATQAGGMVQSQPARNSFPLSYQQQPKHEI
jgi:hypothetical protein